MCKLNCTLFLERIFQDQSLNILLIFSKSSNLYFIYRNSLQNFSVCKVEEEFIDWSGIIEKVNTLFLF